MRPVVTRTDANFYFPFENTLEVSQLEVAPEGEQYETTDTTFRVLELDFEGLY